MATVSHSKQTGRPRGPGFPEGKEFGRLTVESGPFWKFPRSSNRDYYRCKCSCGKIHDASRENLSSGNVTSCGCWVRDRLTTHGGTGTRLHNIWGLMVQRCTNPNKPDFHNYGGRGISVCIEWRQSFEAFRDWALANGYKDGLEIDREDNDSDYCPRNCRWTTRHVQLRNTRRNHFMTAFGETKCFSDWVADPRCMVTADTLRHRLKRWDLVRALTTPVTPKNQRYLRLAD